MLHFKTRNFGEIDIDEKMVIKFDSGLPGFSDAHRFTIICDPEDLDDPDNPFCWLQCLDDTDVAFCMVNVEKFMPSYDPLVDEQELADLGECDPDDYQIFNFVVIPKDPREVTVNLKAPVIINTQNMTGKQIICQNDDYDVRHYLFSQRGVNYAGSDKEKK